MLNSGGGDAVFFVTGFTVNGLYVMRIGGKGRDWACDSSPKAE